GGNIDTTPAVVASGAIFSEAAMEVATIVKFAQNALIGVVAFALACYYVLVLEKKKGERPSIRVIWDRFPKFVLGFLIVSILSTMGVFTSTQISTMKNLYKWLFALTFVSIGLETPLREFRKIGGKPVLAYLIATLYNVALTYCTAWLLFGGILL
ncbi:MAG: YeiH family protein, partial [Candidatus Bathyarchaeia archaeon]